MNRAAVVVLLASLCVACDSDSPTEPTQTTTTSSCNADVEMVDWWHRRGDPLRPRPAGQPPSPAIYFDAKFVVTGATPGCVADVDIWLRITQGGRRVTSPPTDRWGGPWYYDGASRADIWWGGGDGGFVATLLDGSEGYRFTWTWAWCWRRAPLNIPQDCEADEPD